MRRTCFIFATATCLFVAEPGRAGDVRIFHDDFAKAVADDSPLVGTWSDTVNRSSGTRFSQLPNAGAYAPIFPDRDRDHSIAYVVQTGRNGNGAFDPGGIANFDTSLVTGTEATLDYGEVAFRFRNRKSTAGSLSDGRLNLSLLDGTTAVADIDISYIGQPQDISVIDIDEDGTFDDGLLDTGPRNLAWVYNNVPNRTLFRYGTVLPTGMWTLFDLGEAGGPRIVRSVVTGVLRDGTVDGFEIRVLDGISANYAFDDLVVTALSVPEPTAAAGVFGVLGLMSARRR
jgi:hypothetical protein